MALLSSGKNYVLDIPANSGSYGDSGLELTNGLECNYPTEYQNIVGWYNSNSSATLDLGQSFDISHVRFQYSIHESAGVYEPSKLIVYGSNDNSNFVELGTFNSSTDWVTVINGSSGGHWSNNLSVSGKYRYIRFAFTPKQVGCWIFLGELEVCGGSSHSSNKMISKGFIPTFDITY